MPSAKPEDILRGLIRAEYVAVFKGETQQEWEDRKIEEAMKALATTPLPALNPLAFDIGLFLARATALNSNTAQNCAAQIMVMTQQYLSKER